jgi:aspartate aminotransferase
MGADYFRPVRAEYQRRRDVLYEGLKNIPGVIAYKPQGAFYITVKLPIKDCDHFVVWMLTEFNVDGETVMVAPAAGFYATPGKGMDEVRMAYVIEVEKIKRGLEILRVGLAKYKSLFP